MPDPMAWITGNLGALVAGGALVALGGIAAAMGSLLLKNSVAPPVAADPLAPGATDIGAADYWEFVYAAVRDAEIAGTTGPVRMAKYLELADRFLERSGIQGDERRVTIARLQGDAEKVLRELGFNRGTTATTAVVPASSGATVVNVTNIAAPAPDAPAP